MEAKTVRGLVFTLGMAVLAPAIAAGADFNWKMVVNNSVTVPGDTRKFNSYNQPSVNVNGLVVFRARSSAGQSGGEPAHGIFIRDMVTMSPLTTIFDRTTLVPYPNNLSSVFIEPPAFPRIDLTSNTIASRGSHPPVWTYPLSADTETRAGTTGIYTNPFGTLITGASKLGIVPAFDFFEVPGTFEIPFDVFPGAPSVTDGATLVFKGNYTLAGVSQTGVYYRDLINAPTGGFGPVVRVADSTMTIPGTSAAFGSTAPPSAAGRQMVFLGVDNEDNPTLGGIYRAPLTQDPQLTALVKIGDQVPGEGPGTVFNKLGEGLSFDGRFVAFWGAWGTETKALILQCSAEGNKDRAAYCQQQYPKGFKTAVPVNQGIFVYDTGTGSTSVVAKAPGDFDDFVYWNFSGLVPGTGQSDEDGEPARWRSATFVAVSGLVDGQAMDATFHAVFKATRGKLVHGAYVNPVDGIYLRKGPVPSTIATVAETGMDGTLIDPLAVDPLTGTHLPVTALGVERDGFRGNLLAINVSMANEDAGWAGIYLTTAPNELEPGCATDVTTQFEISSKEPRYNPPTDRFVQTVKITRTANGSLKGPFAFALENLSSNVTLDGASGTTTCIVPVGSPYVVVDGGAAWDTGESVTVTLQFKDPTKAAITYTPAVLAGATR